MDKTNGDVLTAGIEKEASIGIEDIDLSTGFAKFNYVVKEAHHSSRWNLEPVVLPIELEVAGYHSVLNAMIAITYGLLEGVDGATIQKALRNFSGVERRFELIYNKDYMILDDHFANEKNIAVTLETLCQMDYKDLHVLYAVRGGRGAALNRDNALEMVKWMDKLPLKTFYATRSEEVVSSKDVVTDSELVAFSEVMKDAGYDVPVVDDLKSAIAKVWDKVGEHDVFLLAGCQGMDRGAKYVWERLADQSEGEEKTYWLNKIENRIC